MVAVVRPGAVEASASLRYGKKFINIGSLALLIIGCMALKSVVPQQQIKGFQMTAMASSSLFLAGLLLNFTSRETRTGVAAMPIQSRKFVYGVFAFVSLIAISYLALSVLSFKGYLTIKQLGQGIIVTQFGPLALFLAMLPCLVCCGGAIGLQRHREVIAVETTVDGMVPAIRRNPREAFDHWVSAYRGCPGARNVIKVDALLEKIPAASLESVAVGFHRLRKIEEYNSRDQAIKTDAINKMHQILEGMIKNQEFLKAVVRVIEESQVNCHYGQEVFFQDLQIKYALYCKVDPSVGFPAIAKMLIGIERQNRVWAAADQRAAAVHNEGEMVMTRRTFVQVLQDRLALPIRHMGGYVQDPEICVIGEQILEETSGIENQVKILMGYTEWRELLEKEYKEEFEAAVLAMRNLYVDFTSADTEDERRGIALTMGVSKKDAARLTDHQLGEKVLKLTNEKQSDWLREKTLFFVKEMNDDRS